MRYRVVPFVAAMLVAGVWLVLVRGTRVLDFVRADLSIPNPKNLLYINPNMYLAERKRVYAVQAQREHIASLLASLRRSNGAWPTTGRKLVTRFGDRQRVPRYDLNHEALDYHLSEAVVNLMRVSETGAEYEIELPGQRAEAAPRSIFVWTTATYPE